MDENYILILIIAILILILYFINFSGNSKKSVKVNDTAQNKIYKPYNPTENFVNNNNCNTGNQIDMVPAKIETKSEYTEGKSILKVHVAMWCGWSKRFLAMLESEEFKQKSKEIRDICVIQIIDCDKEKCDSNLVKGFPTIILQSKSGKIIVYNGNREPQDLINFIKQNS